MKRKGLFTIFILFSLVLQGNVIFYVGFEGKSEGISQKYIYSDIYGSKYSPYSTPFEYKEGIIGKSAVFTWEEGYPGIAYPVYDNFNPERGTISLWVKKTGEFFINPYYPKIWVALGREGFTGDIAIFPLNDEKISVINDGKWHHFVYTWDYEIKKKKQYLDGELIGEASYAKPVEMKYIVFGYRLPGMMDEIVILDNVLSDVEVKEVYRKYLKGKNPFLRPEGEEMLFPLDISIFSGERQPMEDINLGEPIFDNGKRKIYSLKGKWRFQPVDFEEGKIISFKPDKWIIVDVPFFWKPKSSLKEWEGKDINLYPSAIFEKDFFIPSEFKSKRIYIIFEGLISKGDWHSIRNYSDIYINGRFVDSVFFTEKKIVDITDCIQFGKLNRIIILNGRPYTISPESGINKVPLIEVRDAKDFYIGDILINPSVRENSIKLEIEMKNFTSRDLILYFKPKIYNGEGRIVYEGDKLKVRIKEKFNGEITLNFPVKNLECWSPENPYLYYLVLECGDGEKIFDISDKVKFGFREVWVKDGEIYLNGKRLSWRGSSHNYLSGYGFTREDIRLRKTIGQNGDRTGSPNITYLNTLDIADEEGWIVSYEISIPLEIEKPEITEKYLKRIIKLIGNHPSICFWQIGGNGYVNGPHGHPMQIGGIVPEDIRKNEMAYRRIEILNKIDPSRPAFYYRLGVGGNFRSIMHYMGWGTPVQTMEEWPSYWAKNKQEPLVPAEISLILFPSEAVLWQKGSKKVVIAEHSARYFGESVYRKIDEKLASTYNLPDFGLNDWLNSEIRYDIKSFIYERVLRAWRTYGINGYLLHVDGKTSENYKGNNLNKQGETLKRNNSPLLFYIGGKAEDFVSKDHNYFSGEIIEKSLIVVNDTFHDIKGKIEARIRDGKGNIIWERKENFLVNQGERLFIPVSFTAPEVKEKSKFYIEAELLTADGENIKDKFDITVFPNLPQPSIHGKIALIDSTGETKSILDKIKIPYQIVDIDTIDRGLSSLSGFSLLIIGKNSYSEAVKIFKNWMPIDSTVKEGLNVVFLEQKNRYICGLKVENFNNRYVFVRDKSSPLLEGLSDEDFSNWRGESNMLPPYMPWNEKSDWQSDYFSKHGQLNSFGQRRFWHWSNKGMVATFCFEKPQIGNFRILLENGFDLLYTPMIEFYYGKGRILFSQLDIVDHYGIEPVATILFHRIIEEYTKKKSKNFVQVCILEEEGEKLMKELKFEYKKGIDGSILYFSGKKLSENLRDEIEKFLSNGGTLILNLNEEMAHYLPISLNVIKKKVYKTELPNHNVFSGIGMSEFFWQGIKEINSVKCEEGIVSDSGIIGIIPYKNGNIIFIQIRPEEFEDMWQKSKILRIYSTILTNLGVRSGITIDFTAIGGEGKSEEWLPGYEKGEKIDVKSDFYMGNSIDFDPEMHHVW